MLSTDVCGMRMKFLDIRILRDNSKLCSDYVGCFQFSCISWDIVEKLIEVLCIERLAYISNWIVSIREYECVINFNNLWRICGKCIKKFFKWQHRFSLRFLYRVCRFYWARITIKYNVYKFTLKSWVVPSWSRRFVSFMRVVKIHQDSNGTDKIDNEKRRTRQNYLRPFY